MTESTASKLAAATRLKAILLARVTGEGYSSPDYETARTEMLSSADVASLLPQFVRDCRTPDEFWNYLKTDLSLDTYQSRRTFLREQFAPVLVALEKQEPVSVDRVKRGFKDDLEARGFVLMEQIGSGRSGSVYKAQQRSLERFVAVKVFNNPESTRDAKLRARFIHEARLLAIVQHPGIPYVITTGQAEGGAIPYIVMQFVDGQSLRDRLASSGAMALRDACAVARSVLSALTFAHAKSIVHRDVKPENILIGSDGNVYLIDFSIGAALTDLKGLTRVTGDANTPGTVAYMAPEVLEGGSWDLRVDLFAVGVVLYEMLVGRPLTTATIDRDLQAVDHSMAMIIQSSCALDPDKRVASAAELIRAIDNQLVTASARPERGAAICPGVRCPTAQWRGGFRPALLEETSDRHCRACGTALKYACDSCAHVVDGSSAFCPDCGAAMYVLPACEQCGAPLNRTELECDTALLGCSTCRLPF